MATEITSETFSKLVLEKSKTNPVLVDFWAEWCAPCKMLMPLLENIVSEYSGKIDLTKVNTDEEQQLASSFNIRSLPTIKLFKDGEIADEFMGVLPEPAIRDFIEKHLDRPGDESIREAKKLLENGKIKEAIQTIQLALQHDPSYDKLHLILAGYQLDAECFEEARSTFDNFPKNLRQNSVAQSILARIELSEIAGENTDLNALETYVINNPKDFKKKVQLGAVYFSAGNHSAAMEQWLEIVLIGDRKAKELGRENLVRTFEILGADHKEVPAYRRRLAQALN